MNYFAHGRDFLDDPYFLAGTALPDWLSVVDRRAMLRPANLEPHLGSDDPQLERLVRGILQHQQDDARFHATPGFAQLSLEFCRTLRSLLPEDAGFRPHFVGHILVEILLDAVLIARAPEQLASYYQAVQSVEPSTIAAYAERLTGRELPALAHFLTLFVHERFLGDYLDDYQLLFRLNQVMRRVRLAPLPEPVRQMLPAARELVTRRADELLPGRVMLAGRI